MILPENDMQQAAKKKFISNRKKLAQSPQTLSLSSFNLVHRFGKVEIVKIRPPVPNIKEQYFKIPDFPGWSMPGQLIGCIKCRKYDFL